MEEEGSGEDSGGGAAVVEVCFAYFFACVLDVCCGKQLSRELFDVFVAIE